MIGVQEAGQPEALCDLYRARLQTNCVKFGGEPLNRGLMTYQTQKIGHPLGREVLNVTPDVGVDPLREGRI
jgi:hypothetical protein